MPLARSFYLRAAPVVARDLLGCVLVTRSPGVTTAGRIVETEAYLGPEDGASHAAFRPGSRPLFYGEGGIAYVFLAYGVHCCFNAITGRADHPGCVLVRALAPLEGLEVMARRRGVPVGAARLASGPGNVTRALGIGLDHTGADLTRGSLTIEHGEASPRRVATGRRIGITRSADLPLRFWVADDPHVSRARQRAGSFRSQGPDFLG
jgi:DNA-3-methyladenine glycosylase